MKRYSRIAALIAAVAFFMVGCLQTLSLPGHSNPMDPSNPATSSRVPARPSGLAAVIADRLVQLSWTVGDATNIDHYRIYRWEVEDADDEDYELLDTSETTDYEDTDVTNGQGYYYKVAGVNSHGLEGHSSREIIVIPSLYGVTIDQGRDKTGSRSVSLRMSTSGDADMMQVSNAQDLADAQWEPYQSTYSWLLEPGDGDKTVYARFRDAADNESAVVSDGIELDTKAVISAVTEDTGGEEMSSGDVIHLTLTAGELYGSAAVDLGTVVPGVVLYDDGTGGDDVADDGVYERDYTIDYGVEVINGAVVGTFTDEVGNDAEPVLATGTVTIVDPPTAVEMATPVALHEKALVLSWSRNNDSDFSAYEVYRSYVPGVETSADRELIADMSDQSDTDFTDTELDEGTTYYYAVYVVDRAGLRSISNEVSGTTESNEPPTAVELFTPWAPDTTSLELSWTRNEDQDFMFYEVIGWEQDPPSPPNTSEKRILARLTSRDDTFFTHDSLDEDLVYWYEVAVVDSFGAEALSNTVSASP